MDSMTEIADNIIERLKKDILFKDWTDEKFIKLRILLTTKMPDIETEESIEFFIKDYTDLIMGDE